jgi:hypothetical protein
VKTVLAVALCVLLATTGSGTGSSLSPTVTTVPTATPVDMVPTVSYQDDTAGAQERHSAMLAYVSGLQNVVRQLPQAGESFISQSVCSPVVEYCTRYVQTEADLGGPGRAITVSDYKFDNSPKVFGNGVELMYVPSTADHFALSFGYSEDGGGIGGAGYYMEFIYLTPALLAAIKDVLPVDYFDNMVSPALLNGNEFSITDAPEYKTSTNEGIGIPGDARTVIASLDEFMGSAQKFRAHALLREGQLLAQVEAEVHAGRVTKPVDCKYTTNGAAPVCLYTALSSKDRADEIARAKTAIGAAESLIERRFQAMYSVLSSQTVWSTCAGCWSGA